MSIQSDFEGYRRPFREIRDVNEMDIVRRAMAKRDAQQRRVRRIENSVFVAVVILAAILLCALIVSGPPK